ncbi:glycosyltransferase [Mycoplasma simbae]|uniref:glycosyltransferase n=1 Tax=Mycoplasma simbae TaxID=36744 RepID=UPI00068A845E|nr:glycosyltransferase [Mycoplasma simbae]
MKNKQLWRTKADIVAMQSRPLRVLMVGDSFIPMVDGVIRVMENYIEQFQRKNVEFLVLAPAYSDYDIKNDEKLGYKPMRIKCSLVRWGGYQVIRTPLVKEELEQIDKFNPDIIHVHSPFFAGNIGLQLKKRYNVPLILTMHTNFKEAITKSSNSELVGQIGGLLAQQFVKNCDCVFHVSKTSMQQSGFDLNVSKHEVVNNGTKFKYPNNASELITLAKERFNIDTNKNNLLFVSRFVWEKNIKFLLDSFKLVLEKNPNFSLTMVGGEWRYDEIVEYAKQIGVYDHIIFTGVVRDFNLLKGLYLSHDLFVFPSVFDTFGLVVHEAASQGLASLVIEGSAAGETITDDDTGYLCVENEQAYANKILEIFENKIRLRIVGQHAKALPLKWSDIVDFSIEQYYQVIKEYYKKFRSERLEKLATQIRKKFSHTL